MNRLLPFPPSLGTMLLPLDSLPAPRRQRPPTLLRSLVPNNVDLLPFPILVLEAEDAGLVELSDAGEVVRALVDAFLLSSADRVEGLELPPGVLLRKVNRVSEDSFPASPPKVAGVRGRREERERMETYREDDGEEGRESRNEGEGGKEENNAQTVPVPPPTTACPPTSRYTPAQQRPFPPRKHTAVPNCPLQPPSPPSRRARCPFASLPHPFPTREGRGRTRNPSGGGR